VFRGVIEKKYGIKLPEIPEYASNNGHMYYLICQDSEQRSQLISDLKEKGILAVFHYLSLHKSPYYQNKYIGNDLALSDHYTDCLVRLPLYFELSQEEQESIINSVLNINLSIS
jgi:dTDP-4-amino-4,6-dideoxygalactose transaminase